MKFLYVIIVCFVVFFNLQAQLPISSNRVITNESTDCINPKFIINENGESLIVYSNNGTFYYDLFSSNFQKIIEHKNLQPSSYNYLPYYKISEFDQDHFVLFWIDDSNVYLQLNCRVFERYGMPGSDTIQIGIVDEPYFYVSQKADINNDICISYNTGENIVVRYLKSDRTLSDEINIFSITGVSDNFFYATDFLPNQDIIFHWTDYSREIYTLIFDSIGDKISEDTLVTENTSSNYIVTRLYCAHNHQGDFYVIWPHYTEEGVYKIYAQKYLKNKTKYGSAFSVTDASNALAPYDGQIDVSIDKDGDMAVVWSDNLANAPSILLYGQLVDRDNNKVGENFVITEPGEVSDISQYDPLVQMRNDQLIICWNNYDLNYGDLWTVNMNISNIDDGNVPPTFISEIKDQEVYSMDTLILEMDESVIYDPDQEEVFIQILVDTMTIPPYWISYDNKNKKIAFTPSDYHHGNYKITLIGLDSAMLSDTTTFNLQVKSRQHTFTYNGLVLHLSNHEQEQFILNVENANICKGEILKVHELIETLNRQDINYSWQEKSMSEYIEGPNFERSLNEDTWIAIRASDEYSCTLKDTIWVTMKPSPEFQFSLEDSSCFVIPTVLNVTGTNLTYSWESGESGSEITLEEAGWYKVTATNQEGCMTVDSIYLTICTGLDKLTSEISFSVYPNPTNGLMFIKIETPGKAFDIKQIIVYNQQGNIVYNQQYDSINDYPSIIGIDLTRFRSGIYLISILDKKQNQLLTKIMVH